MAMSGCALLSTPPSPLLRQTCQNPDAQLAQLLQPLEDLRAKGCDGTSTEKARLRCEELEREIVRLGVVCPTHAPTLMANAVIAYVDGQRAVSQQYLDVLLAQPRPYPDAAGLRSRIAMEEGNLSFAHRMLEQHIRLAPDHAGLREAYAAVLYLERRLPEARTELTTAGALGAPRWRLAYHLGLIEEALGRNDAASRLYAEALQGNPGWVAAESRLKGLRAQSTPP